jgi:hypothetical protein
MITAQHRSHAGSNPSLVPQDSYLTIDKRCTKWTTQVEECLDFDRVIKGNQINNKE